MKSLVTAICGAALITVPLSSLTAQPAGDLEMVARIRAEGLDRSQVLATFNVLTNVIGPRLTSSPAHKLAADWAVERLSAWGMANVHLEPFEFGRGWSLEGFTLEMVQPRYFPMIGYPEAWSPSTDGELLARPVFLGDKTAAEITRLKGTLGGAIVLAQPPQTEFIEHDRVQPADYPIPVELGAPRFVRNDGPVPYREMAEVLRGSGAGVILQPNQGEHGTLFVRGRRDTPDDAVPSVVLAAEHYNLIVRMLEAGEPVRLRVNVQTRYHDDDLNSYNVIAEIPGTDPALRSEVVMFGAHLDSWHSATGGTDNADGVAAVMEAMRILEAVGARPRRTIRVALWGGEEQGLHGSRQWVQRHLAGEANRDAREQLSVYFNQDIGGGATYGLYLQGNDAARPILDTWLAPLVDLGARRNVEGVIGSSDHMSFLRAGVPAFSTVQDYEDYDTRTHHTNMDFYERLNESDLKQSAIVLATLVYQAAMREGAFPRPPRESAGR